MNYTITKNQDVYTLLNNDATDLTYTLQKITDCVNYSNLSTNVLAQDEEVELELDGDGDYNLVLKDGVDTVNVSIKYYYDLQISLIESIFNNICDCSCGCGDCSETNCTKYCNLLMARAKMDVYKKLTNPNGSTFFDDVYEEVKCLIKKPIYCSVAEEAILGEVSCNEKIVKQLLALDYLALYFYEYDSAVDTEEEDYIKTKFNTEKIFCCIQELGINIGKTEK